jgi:radical SAM-linked protein
MVKEGLMMFLSHLELMKTLERCFKSAGLPMAHSQGFNPRPLMNFALPLAVGVEAQKLLLEIELMEGAEASLLEKVKFPRGLSLHSYKVVEKSPSLMSLVESARYLLTGDKEKLRVIEHGDPLLFSKRNKKGHYRERDAREFILAFEEELQGYEFLLQAGSKANLKPTDLLLALLGKEEEVHGYNVRLMDVYDREGSSLW